MIKAIFTNHPLANIAFLVVLIMGFLAYSGMPREQDPEINFNWVDIIATLPGASAEDIEKRVTKPLEDAIKQVSDIKFISSISREGTCNILMRFRDIPDQLFDKRMNDVRREIQNKSKSELPREVNEPLINEITTSSGFPTAMILVTGPANDEQLRQKARMIKEDIERIKGVDRVLALGLHDPELQVDFDLTAAASRGVNGVDIANSIAAWFQDSYAGTSEVANTEWLVRMVGQTPDPERIAKLNIIPNPSSSSHIPLETLAQVSRARSEPDQLVSYAGKPAVLFSIAKRSYTNTLQLVDALNNYIVTKNQYLGDTGIQVVLLDDQTIPTRTAVGIMESNAVYGLLLVLIVVWIFLGSRIAILVSLGIPFSLAGTLWLLSTVGYTLNISVLLGIVIALGMLVDDAIVIVESIYYNLQKGLNALDSAVGAIQEVGIPVFTSSLTTMAAFLPLLLLPGILGKFMFVIPLVVSLALMISLVEAFWMLPTHVCAWNLGDKKPSLLQPWRDRFTHWLRIKYTRLLIRVMRFPKSAILFLVVVFGMTVYAYLSGAIRIEFFAFDPLRLFYVNVELPPDAALETTLQETEYVEREVKKHLLEGETRSIASTAGIQFTDTEVLYGDQYGQIIVSLKPRTGGMRETPAIIAAMRSSVEALSGFAKVTFQQISGGPPVTKPIRIRVRGENESELKQAANALKAIILKIPGTQDVKDDNLPGKEELVFVLDPVAIANTGLNPDSVSRLLRLHVDGEIIAEIRDQGDKIKLRIRALRDKLGDIKEILSDPIALGNGRVTTLGALVTAETRTAPGLIKRYNLRRSITVEADLNKKTIDTVAANEQVKSEWAKISQTFPNSNLDFSGELEDIEESISAMKKSFLLGVGLIYLILAAQFQSYFQPLMILITVPLAFIGVGLGLLLTNNPATLYTIYGVVALTGIVVNSAIVLIDAANARLKAGMSLLHASIYAARRRVVAILITSVTTIGGLFSLAAGIGGKSLLWGPVAASIVWGLSVATVLTLFFIPLVYRLSMSRSKLARPMTIMRHEH